MGGSECNSSGMGAIVASGLVFYLSRERNCESRKEFEVWNNGVVVSHLRTVIYLFRV